MSVSLLSKALGWRIHRDGASGWFSSYTTEGPDGSPIRVLNVEGAYQSATFLDERRFEAPFSYLRSFEAIFQSGRPMRRVLMLGGGGFAYPKHLLVHHEDVVIDVVEISSAVIEVARRRFFLEEAERRFGERLAVIEDDAESFLRKTENRYDAILNDLFCGCEQNAFFLSEAGCLLAKRRLAPSGLYVSNVVVSDDREGRARLASAVDAASAVFTHVASAMIVEPAYTSDDNYLVIASNEPF